MSARGAEDARATAGAPAGGEARGIRPWIVAGALLLTAGLASWAADLLIRTRFADRPSPRDLILDAIPYVPVTQYLADGTVTLAMLVLAVVFVRRAPHDIPRAVAMFGAMYWLRAVMIVLTPLASPHGQTAFGILPPQFGMFPSGHSANVLLCWLLARAISSPRTRNLLLGLAVTEWVALLLSRGHYSIDILGGLLLTYFVFTEWTKGSLFAPLRRLVEAAPAG